MPELNAETVRFPSADGVHTVAGVIYTLPGVEVRAVIQLSHGMCEYVRRYRQVAAFYAARGIAFAGNDHLGHGDTAGPGELGYFADHDGAEYLLRDLHTMNGTLHRAFPGRPVILYGHSMGSFFARWYAERFGDTIDLLILSGTRGPSPLNGVGRMLAGTIAALRGPRHISPFMTKLGFAGYNKRIAAPASPNAWISRDEAVVRDYDADEKCIFHFTASAYRDMLGVLCHVSTRRWAAAVRKELPVLLIAGDGDPVGDYGAGVRAVWALLGDAGVRDLTCQIWEGGRHEMHNETNRDEVFDYCLTWIDDHLKGESDG